MNLGGTTKRPPTFHFFVCALVAALVASTLSMLLLYTLFPLEGHTYSPFIIVGGFPFYFVLVTTFSGIPASAFIALLMHFKVRNWLPYIFGGVITASITLMLFNHNLEWLLTSGSRAFFALLFDGAAGGLSAWVYLSKISIFFR